MKKAVFCIMLCIILGGCDKPAAPAMETRKSALAGRWYSDDPRQLAADIDLMLGKGRSGETAKDPLLLILPHAGYQFSGPTAAKGYNAVRTARPDIIIIIGPSHYSFIRGCSITPVDFYETPLGRVPVDRKTAERLLKSPRFSTHPSAHEREHSIEIHLPFLQRLFGKLFETGTTILPVLAGDMSDDDARSIARDIIGALPAGKRPLFIISSDFTHYGERFSYIPFGPKAESSLPGKIESLDRKAIDLILKKDMAAFSRYVDRTGITICGRNPIRIALSLDITGFSGKCLAYTTSGAVTGDFTNSVSYAAILFTGHIGNGDPGEDNAGLTPADRKFLLKLARDNITSHILKKGPAMVPSRIPESLQKKRGVFVTLKIGGALRGCIGYVEGIKPLYQAVIDNSYNAAFRDPRFSPLENGELSSIKIEISVLTEPVRVARTDDIVIGRDGLIIERGASRGLLLPQVPVEWKWNLEEYLFNLCRKAGLPGDAWKDRGTRLFRFQAVVFHEEGMK